jgi:hypothetical protein
MWSGCTGRRTQITKEVHRSGNMVHASRSNYLWCMMQIICKMSKIKFHPNNMNREDDFHLSKLWKEQKFLYKDMTLIPSCCDTHWTLSRGTNSLASCPYSILRGLHLFSTSRFLMDYHLHMLLFLSRSSFLCNMVTWQHLPLLILTLKMESACSSKMLVLHLQQYTVSEFERTQSEYLLQWKLQIF